MSTTSDTSASIARRVGVIIATAALALAACGGSDDESDSVTDDTAAPEEAAGDDAAEGDADSSDDSSGDDAGSDDSSGDDSSGDDAGSDEATDSDDAESSDGGGGAGTNDEAQETFDEAGVDLDLDDLEDTISQFSTGDGGGTVTIDGAAYPFEAQICIAQGPSFTAEGLSQAPDGTPAWVSISYSNDFDFDGDGESDETLDVYVEVGKAELFGSGADDQPNWVANKIDGGTINSGEDITVSLDGDSISGGGPINDYSGVAVPFGETAPMTFEANCS